MDSSVRSFLESELMKIDEPARVDQKNTLNFYFPETLCLGFDQDVSEILEGEKPFLEVVREFKKSKAYYLVENHHELHELGRSFDKDIEAGARVFSFAAVAKGGCLSRTVLGIAAHIEFHSNRKIKIISKNQKFFESYFAESDLVSCQQYSEEHFKDDSIVLWEMPRTPLILKQIDDFYPSLVKADSCSIIVAENVTTYKDIEKVRSFYSKYNITVKGLILDKEEK